MAITTANQIFAGDHYKPSTQGVIASSGRIYIRAVARGQITDTLKSAIELKIYPAKPLYLHGKYPPLPFTIPVGAQITRVDFRLPLAAGPGDTVIDGIYIPKNCNIIGTAGERLKISPTSGTTHSVTSPVLVCGANNTYTPETGAVASRPDGVADQPSPSLLTTVTGAPMTLQATVSNAGNTAAGNGIALSTPKATALIYAQVIYSLDGDAIQQYHLDLPFSNDNALAY